MGVIRYISDLHFDHTNILHFDNRPFISVEQMNEELIKRWKSVVNNDDHTYIWLEILQQLNGQKTLIQGNHDITPSKLTRRFFADVKDYKEINDNGRRVVLCHYPIPCYKNHFYGWYHCYGHVHTSFEHNMMLHDKYLMSELYSAPCRMFNVGAMLPYMDFTPRTLDELIASEAN